MANFVRHVVEVFSLGLELDFEFVDLFFCWKFISFVRLYLAEELLLCFLVTGLPSFGLLHVEAFLLLCFLQNFLQFLFWIHQPHLAQLELFYFSSQRIELKVCLLRSELEFEQPFVLFWDVEVKLFDEFLFYCEFDVKFFLFFFVLLQLCFEWCLFGDVLFDSQLSLIELLLKLWDFGLLLGDCFFQRLYLSIGVG